MRHITQQPVALAITLGSLALCIAYAFGTKSVCIVQLLLLHKYL